MEPIKVKCIDAKNRPSEFPINLWVTEGDIYHIVKLDKMHQMGGILGVQLAEIDTTNNWPYTHFAFYRFRPVDEDGELTDEELEDLLDDVFVEELELNEA